MVPVDRESVAICILGMHRSGTSTVARAINLLGVYLGEADLMGGSSIENPKGYWEHVGIQSFEERLLAALNRRWDSPTPLLDGWPEMDVVRPFKTELAQLVAATFSDKVLWGWKNPRTCLSLPLWREVLEEKKTKLSCVFVVRNPIDVASSLDARNSIPFNIALGIWFHYNIAALKAAGGLPVAFICYEDFLMQWEPELRRCADRLRLGWPSDETRLRDVMKSFIDPTLRHNQAPPQRLKELPRPVQELYDVLCQACANPAVYDDRFDERINQLYTEFYAYASLFPPHLPVSPPSWLSRTGRRWQRSLRKRLGLPKQKPTYR